METLFIASNIPLEFVRPEVPCRHVVKDRLEQTGMHWNVNGAQATLQLRAIYLNGQWGDFINYRIQTEQATLYRRPAA